MITKNLGDRFLELIARINRLEDGVPDTIADFGAIIKLEDDRLWRLTDQVWRRLPARDRYILFDLLEEINDDRSPRIHDTSLAFASGVEPDTCFDGCVAEVAKNVSYIVSLHQVKNIKSDIACLYVIAHEFAHVVLRHIEFNFVIGSLLPFKIYTEVDRKSLREWHEDQADLQARVWGFEEEFKAFLDEFPKARRPRWYVEQHIGDEISCKEFGPIK